MAKGRRICRGENKAVEVADKLFFNKSYSSMNSLRAAAKRFAQTPEFTDDCFYYEGSIVNGRWSFRPVGKKMS